MEFNELSAIQTAYSGMVGQTFKDYAQGLHAAGSDPAKIKAAGDDFVLRLKAVRDAFKQAQTLVP